MVSKQSAPAQPGSQSISRAIYLLSVVAAEGKTGGARLSAIAEKTGLHIATTRRILQALVADGLLGFDLDSKIYTIGPAILSFAAMGNPWFNRLDIFKPVLDRIAEKTHDTAFFSVRSGAEAVCLARREGGFPIKVLSLETGGRRPLGVGAPSAAILAFLSPEERRTLLEQNAVLYLEHNKLQVEDVASLIELAHRTGYAFDAGKVIPDVYGVAIPILVDGRAVASVGVVAISARMEIERRLEIVNIIRNELAKIPGVKLPAPHPDHIPKP
jgi:DNA-binding IclR family transcriptional regulator